ncbi:MAG: carbonic anhydrase [Rikenellaceae bacterium]
MRKLYFTLLAALVVALTSCGTAASVSSQDLVVETPLQAIDALKSGNARYVAGESINPNADQERRDETLNSQSPYAAVVACSDSRVPVELLFDQGIGDLFVIRTAGNSVAGDVVMGSVDYAIDHLNVPLVVVLGHQNCGGVTSVISVSHDHEEHHHNGSIGAMLAALAPSVEPYIGHPDMLDEAIHVNAAAQVDAIESVDYIREKIEAGELKVVSAYYNIGDGKVTFEE